MSESEEKTKQEDDRIQAGSFGQAPIELIEIHPVFAEYFNLEALMTLAQHPLSESVTRAAVAVSKLPVVLKGGKSKTKKYLLTGNLDVYFAALSLAEDPLYGFVTVVVDEDINELAMINAAVHRLLVPLNSPVSNSILAATYMNIEFKKKENGYRYSLPLYENSPDELTRHDHIKLLTGADSRAWDKVKDRSGLSHELFGLADQAYERMRAKKAITNKHSSENK